MLLRLCHPTARAAIPTPRNGPSAGPTPDAVRLEPPGEQVRAVVEEWAQAGDGMFLHLDLGSGGMRVRS